MASHEAPVELEVTNEDFVVTLALARMLVKLARRYLERETDAAKDGPNKEEGAA
jgi:hypothetical protein